MRLFQVLFLEKCTRDSKQREEYFESVFENFTPIDYGLLRNEVLIRLFIVSFPLERYHYIVHDTSAPKKEFLESIFRFHIC